MKLDEKIKEKSEYKLNYDNIEGKIDFKKYTKEETIFSKIIAFFKTKKLVLSLTAILLVLVIGFLILRSNMEPKPKPFYDPAEEPGNDSNEIPHNFLYNEASLLGVAAYYEFDKTNASKLSNVIVDTSLNPGKTIPLSDTEQTEEYIKVTYPYDYVRIVSAYKFSINVSNIADAASKKIIERSCGLGNLEVVVADFETYVEKDGVRILSVTDILISLRGYNGYYTILASSGHREDGDYIRVFSSYKKLLEDEVSKDFTPPILSIFLEEKSNNERYVYFETSDNILSIGSYHRDQAFKNTTEIERISSSTLYSIDELTTLPKKKLVVSILTIDIENKCIEIEGETNLKYLYFTKYTKGAEITTLNVGDTIKIEYDFLFEGYDPTYVFVNTITVEQISKEEVN